MTMLLYNHLNQMVLSATKMGLILTNGQPGCSRFIHGTAAAMVQRTTKKFTQRVQDTIQDGRQIRFLNTKQPSQSDGNPVQPGNVKKPTFDFKKPPGHFMEVDGMRIHYEKLGTGSEVLFMMASGMGSTRIDYHDQLEGLDRNRFTLIAWDPPGYGFSRPPEKEFPLDIANHEARLGYKFLRELGVDKANIIGFSYGGVAAMILAADRPEVAKKLVLIESFPFYTDQHMIHDEALRQLVNWSPTERQRSLDVYGEEYLVKKTNEFLDHGIRIRNMNSRNLCMDKLVLIRCPTLLLHSKRSKSVAQEHPSYMVNAIRDARLVMLEKGSHFLLKEKPKLTNKIVTDFIFENEEDNNSDYDE